MMFFFNVVQGINQLKKYWCSVAANREIDSLAWIYAVVYLTVSHEV